MPFTKGQSGNPNGRPKAGLAFTDQLRLELARRDRDGVTRLRKIAAALVDKAEAGDVQAIREIADRVDGRPPMLSPEDQVGQRPIVIEMTELDLRVM